MTELNSIDYSNDILKPMQDADLLMYRDLCAKRLPYTLHVHHFLTIQHRWMETYARPENETLTRNVSQKCKKTFYAPRTACIDKCTFVAIADQPYSEEAHYCVYAFTLEWPPIELMSCLNGTARIDWHAEPLIESLSAEFVPFVDKMLADKQVTYDNHPVHCVWMPNEEAIVIDINIPDEIFFDELHEHHASIINATWEFRDDTSCNYIRSIIQLNGGLGLFDKSTKHILAWMLVNEYFAFGFLETISTARRKGFAKLLVQKYCRQFATNEKLDVFTYIVESNAASQQLFESIGFRLFHKLNWLSLEKRAPAHH